MSGFWQDHGRCLIWRDSRHGRETSLDDPSWRESSTAGTQADEFPHGLQGQRDSLGAIGRGGSLYELEVGEMSKPQGEEKNFSFLFSCC